MYNRDSGVECNDKRLLPLTRVVRGWQDVIQKYCKVRGDDDAPYWYNERANISMLAAGAWQSGMIALEEFNTEKSRIGRRPLIHGSHRCDLAIASKKHIFRIEAKRQWLDGTSKQGKRRKIIEKTFESASEEAERNSRISDLGCAFFVTHWTKHKSSPDIDERIDQVLRETLDIQADLWAWCFPRKTRNLTEKEGKILYQYPGILLGMRAGKNAKFETRYEDI
jgi:hypothetical protein